MNISTRSLVFALLGFACAQLPAVAQTIVLQDSFSLNGTTRTAGASLVGTSPDIGSGTWSSSFYASNSVFNSSGQIVQAANSTTEARISIDTPASIVTLQADMKGLNGGWSSIGFTSSTSSSAPGAWSAAGYGTVLWTRIQSSSYYINVNGTAYTIASGSISGFSYSKIYTVSLSYDPSEVAVSLSISTGGAEVVNTGWLSVESVSASAANYLSSTSIGAVGFRLNGAVISTETNMPLIDNFQLTSIPEPATASLFIGGFVGLCSVVTVRRNCRR